MVCERTGTHLSDQIIGPVITTTERKERLFDRSAVDGSSFDASEGRIGFRLLEVLQGPVFFEFLHFGMMGDPVPAWRAGGVLFGTLAFIAMKTIRGWSCLCRASTCEQDASRLLDDDGPGCRV